MSRAINFVYNMTHQEIADVLGVSRQTIRITEIRALKKLKRNPVLKQHFLDHISSSSEFRSLDQVPSA